MYKRQDLIVESMLNKTEKKWLNSYHRKVFNNLKSAMNKSEFNDLKIACSAI